MCVSSPLYWCQEGKPRLLVSPRCLEWWWRHSWWPGSAGHRGKWDTHTWDNFQELYLCCCCYCCCFNQSSVWEEEVGAGILSTQEHCTVSAICLCLSVWERGRAGEEINGLKHPLWHDEWLDLLCRSVFLLQECACCYVSAPPRSPVYLFNVNRRLFLEKKRRKKKEQCTTVCRRLDPLCVHWSCVAMSTSGLSTEQLWK